MIPSPLPRRLEIAAPSKNCESQVDFRLYGQDGVYVIIHTMQRLPTNAISILSALWVALAVVVSGLQVARADQTDNRLDNLFTRLLEAPAPGAAQLVVATAQRV